MLFSCICFTSQAAVKNSSDADYYDNYNAGHGLIHMPGVILDAPCSIDVSSRYQTVNLSVSSIYGLMVNRFGPEKSITIKLVNCTYKHSNGDADWKSMRFAFIGDVDKNSPSLFSLRGNTSGVGVQVRGNDGLTILPGKTYEMGAPPNGEAELKYNVRLAADTAKLEPGKSYSTIKFLMDYD